MMKKKRQMFKYIWLYLYFNGSSEITLHIFFIFKVVSSQDPCTNNRELSEPTRSVEYSLAPTDPDLCDRIITEGWYRIPENGNIPTECPPILRCGSTSPIWINGECFIYEKKNQQH